MEVYPSGRTRFETTLFPNKFGNLHLVTCFFWPLTLGCNTARPGFLCNASNFSVMNSAALTFNSLIFLLLKLNSFGGTNIDLNT